MTAIAEPTPFDLAEHRSRAWSRSGNVIRDRIRLPPKLTGSEWADRHRVLSSEASAEAGPWRTSRAPYLREIMDEITLGDYQDFTIVKCSQSGGTEIINNIVGYYIDQEPSSILVIQPNVKPMAESWSKDRLAPMLRDSPKLRSKVRDPKSRNSGNTVLHKIFPGGHITVVGANSPAGLASRPIRVVAADEWDRWGASAGTEGDPMGLAEARMITYRHRKRLVKVSTPGNEGQSRIEKAWALSDQRHYYVPCPHCGHEQPLEWRDSKDKPDIRMATGRFRLLWEQEPIGSDLGAAIAAASPNFVNSDGDKVHRPDTAAYLCRSCEQLIEEVHKPAMLDAGRWVKHNPGSKKAGWFISGLLSPWVRWAELATKWLEVHEDPEQKKVFVNTKLGLLYSHEGQLPDAASLEHRREKYEADVPLGVGALTLGIDVHDDRLECEVRGWGNKEESWNILLDRMPGDPDTAETWEGAQALLDRAWKREDGKVLRIAACMVDSGHMTDAVYRWVRPRQIRRVFAYKGKEGAKEPISRASRANRDGVRIFTVDPNKFKDILFARLRRQKAGPGYLHFGPADKTGTDSEYFAQFGAEKREVVFENNVPKVTYKLIRKRNEAIDLYVLNLAALRSLGMTFSRALGKKAKPIPSDEPRPDTNPDGDAESPPTDGRPDPPDDPPPPPKAPKQPPRRWAPGGWMRRFR